MIGELRRPLTLALLATLATMLFGACAQPKYESIAAPAEQSGENKNENPSGESDSAACEIRFKSSGLCVSWRWEAKPTGAKVGALVFKVFRQNLFDASPIETDLDGLPAVVLWMPSMGHGSSPTTVTRLDVGTYRASKVFFVMPGEWQIKIQLKNGNDVSDEALVSLTI